ncbi:translation initiation factor IF-2 [Rariglobus hedericola]|uniref:Translation initiation factor IF-2 n=1 Tax=Rariglobus hedericola TaxID=2597822 RepID=A0A556QP40_9BACT|nr:translation initiation factor IF-2 [Rariglobus hedericola]TSJ78401.1 translation initiation factor IF-2 [Rariglobus hedericola]
MSIRIHELAKRHNMEAKDMLALLKERGFVSADTKSVSSTLNKIYEEEIEKEFAAKAAAEAPAPAAVEVAPEPAPLKVPSVKSAEDVVREKEEAKAALAAPVISAPAPVSAPKPTPVVSAPAPVSAPRPISAPQPLPPRSVSAPAPVPAISRPAPVSAPVRPPAPVPGIASAPRPAPVLPPPVSRPAAVSAPAPVSAPRATLPIPGAPKPPPAIVSAPGNPAMPATPPAQTATITTEGDIKVIHLKPPIIVRDFATALGMKPFKLISELMEMGIFASMNQAIDEPVAIKVGEKHGFQLEIKHRGEAAQQIQQSAKEKAKVKEQAAAEAEVQNLAMRPPVVCILGHVDHGKTSLLDAIRKADVAAGEAGGITQHIGAYQIEHSERKITFLDTPGHAAFTKMRARGADVTDIAVLVVAADDGFMPQTDEALKHAQNAGVTLMVAINKMDVKGANIERVKQQMQERNIAPEDWGGETVTVPVSALKGTGITDLLDMILLQADVLELKANAKTEASGIIIESQIEVGRGPLATVIVQRGTLRVGDSIVCGPNWAKVRAMFDDQGKNIKEAPPSTPVRVIGWSGAPDSGAEFKSVKNAREAENLAEEAEHLIRKNTGTTDAAPKEVSVESLFANIAATQAKTLKLIIKTDVFGSTEAVRNVLENIKSSKVSLEIVSVEVGLVSKTDILLASAAGAVVIGFNTKLENGVTPVAKHHGVRIETYGIIYELADKVRDMMADMLDPDLKENKTGAAEVRATFPLAKGFVAGCLVTEGKITRNGSARLRRKKEIVFEGKVSTLKRFKDDANEVRAGIECGIKLGDFNGYEIGDVIECYEIQKVRASL